MSATETEWLAILRAYAATHGQKATARRIGYSAGLVCSVLAGSYKGDLKRVQTAIEGALMGRTVDCPVVGEIPRQACVGHQRRANDPKATNPSRIALSQACPSCEHATQIKAAAAREPS